MAVGETFQKKYGPLPLWAWMGLGLGVALAFSVWTKNKKGTGAASDAAPADPLGYELPGNLPPSYSFPINTTVINAPPAGGRDGPPGPAGPPGPVGPGPAPVPVPVPTPVPVPPRPTPAPPKPVPAPPAGRYVKVVKYTSQNPAWNSTLWGIAENSYGKGGKYGTGGGKAWGTIWNAPQNAALVKKRGKPENIQPGDMIWVPKI